MKSILLTISLVTWCCLSLSQNVEAQVINASSDVSYYAPTNSMRASVYISPDYSAQAYYCVIFYAYVYKDDVYQTLLGGDNYCTSGYCVCAGDAHTETYIPYDPAAEYSIETEHYADMHYRYVDESGYETGEYYDYYDFFEYTDGMLVYYPLYYAFTGNGPPRNVSLSSILLGLTSSVFSEGATAGAPHHLKITDDKVLDPAVTGTVCGQKERQIKYQVVDETGRGAGRVAVGETFPGAIISSCTGQSVPATPCSSYFGGDVQPNLTDRSGKFTDRLKVGCPAASDGCGFTIDPNKWDWCKPRDYTSVRATLAKVVYDVRKRAITVNGRGTPWPKNTEFFPDGSTRTP